MLRKCLASVFDQTLQPDEVLVSQDGVDHETVEAVAEFGLAHHTNIEPLGQLRNRQRALSLAQGNYVGMIDDDDVWAPEFLARTYGALERSPASGFASSDHWIIDSADRVLTEESKRASQRFGRSSMRSGTYGDVLQRTLTTMPFPLQFSLFRSSTLAEIGGIPSAAGTTPDFGLMLRLGCAGIACEYIAERLGSYRVHTGQHTAVGRVEMSGSRVETLRDGFSHCSPNARSLLARRYREAVIEHGIALAHDRQRSEALSAIRHYGDLGLGTTNVKRVAVLAGLMVGAGKG